MGQITKDYIKELINKDDGLYEFKNEEKQKEIPAITDEALQLIKVLIRASNVKKILEIGTATGSSAMFFASQIGDDADITTIERDDFSYLRAGENISSFGFDGRIRVLHGSAAEILSSLNESYDMVFLDGAKGQYINMLNDCVRLTKPGGLFVADNVLFRGMVSGEAPEIKRKVTIIKRLRQFLKAICDRDDLITTVLEAGDGVSVSVKKI